MNIEALWTLRDARGINSDEKAFLFVAISRGDELFGTWETNAADMGMSKNRYYRTRDSLLAKGLIEVARKYNGSSVYRVNVDALSHYGNAEGNDSHYGNEDSHYGNDDSHYGETKKNIKNNKKKNLKNKNNHTDANAPVDTESSLQREVREDSKSDTDSSFEVTTTAPVSFDPIPTDAATPSPYADRTGADWNAIRKQRPLTQDERDYISETARMANAARTVTAPVDDDAW